MTPQERPAPTLYATLMNRALETPLPQWKEGIEMHLRGLSDALVRYGEEVIRDGYVAGVSDGFVQGAVAESDAERLRIARDALCAINNYTGGNIVELMRIASDAVYAIDQAGPLGA